MAGYTKKELSEMFDHLKGKKKIYLMSFIANGNHRESAKIAGIHRQTHYDWLKNDPVYKEAYDKALEMSADLLEAEAWKRATEGVTSYRFDRYGTAVKDPVTGKPYVEHKYSDTLLIFLLKALRPEKYRENIRQTISSDDDKPIRIVLEGDAKKWGK